VEKNAVGIDEFCKAHSISRSFYFLLKQEGRQPREMRVGNRVLISNEAAAEWRRKCEGLS
jgi:hypothetical protein